MIIYEQRDSYIEDGSGEWEIVFRISDEQRGTFVESYQKDLTAGTLDDLTISGSYTGTEPLRITVNITETGTPDKFQYLINNVMIATDIPITLAPYDIGNGLFITFGNTTGHDVEFWVISVIGNIKDLLEFVDISKAIELKTGALAEDEMNFSIGARLYSDENRSDYKEVLEFLLDAQDTINKRYISVFCARKNTILTNEYLMFAGVVFSEQSWDDINISDSTWLEIVDPIKEWKFRAQPFFENVFDDVDYSEVIEKFEQEYNESTENWENDLTWKNANVADRDGYYYHVHGQTVKTVVNELVNLNKVIERHFDIVTKILSTEKGIDVSFIMEKSSIDGLFAPARYNYPKPQYHWTGYEVAQGIVRHSYYAKANDSKTLKFGITEDDIDDEADDVSPFIHYRLLKPQTTAGIEYNSKEAERFLWGKLMEDKTFTEFLYFLAYNFNAYVFLEFQDLTTMKIRFTGRNGIVGSDVYIKDVTKSSGKTADIPMLSENLKVPIKVNLALSWYNANSGEAYYYYDYKKKTITPRSDYKWKLDYAKEEQLLVSISPTLCIISNTPRRAVPHNTSVMISYDGMSFEKQYSRFCGSNTQSLHTAIYTKVAPIGGISGEPATDYFVPIISWKVEDGTFSDMSFFLAKRLSMEDYYYNNELNIECPFLNNFSANSDGSNPCWNKLQIGSKLQYGGLSWIVLKIKRNLKDKTTSITLQNSARFDFTTLQPSSAITPNDINFGTNEDQYGDWKITADTIIENNAVAINGDGIVEEAKSFSKHYGNIYGLARANGTAGNKVPITLEGGTVEFADCSIIDGIATTEATVGQKVYVNADNYASPSGCNLSVNPILVATGNPPNKKDLNACIGYFITPNILKLDFSEQFIVK